MNRLIVATTNQGKLRELHALLSPLGLSVEPLRIEVDEDQPSFVGNAEKKARAALAATGVASLADDSGLEVDALGGAPGVRSARYAEDETEPHAPVGMGRDAANNARLLRALATVDDQERTARFRCALVLVTAAGDRIVAEGACAGRILRAPRGTDGFGYDPLFEVDGLGLTMAELDLVDKNRVSHRARALAELTRLLRGRSF